MSAGEGGDGGAAASVEPTATPAGGAPGSSSAAMAPATGAPAFQTRMTIPMMESESLVESIRRLKAEQKHMKDAKKKIAKDLKNAEKRRSRLKKRATRLSDADLVAVLQMRGSITEASSSCSTSAASGSSAPPSVAASAPEVPMGDE